MSIVYTVLLCSRISSNDWPPHIWNTSRWNLTVWNLPSSIWASYPSNHTSSLVPHHRQSTCTAPPPVHLYRASTSPITSHVLFPRQSTCTVPPPVHRYRNSASPQVPQLGQSTGTATPPVHLCILCHSQILNPFKISSKRKRNNVVISFWSCVHRTPFYIFLFYMQR